MPKYKVKAYTSDGRIVEEIMEAEDLDTIIDTLNERGYSILTAQEIEEKPLKEEKKESRGFSFSLFKGVSDKDISVICRQLSAMINAGVGIVDALDIVADQIPNRKLAETLREVAREVSEGSSLYNAMRKRKDIFPELVINLVSAGEETGELDVALQRASEYYEKLAMIKSKIKSASFYPAFVMFVAVVIVTAILYFLVPIFANIYESFGGSLPLPTQMLINASNFLRENFLLIFGSVIAIFFIFRYLYKNNYGFRKSVHRLLLRMPVFKDLVIKSAMAKFSRTMATMFASGVQIERALEVSGEVAGNLVIKEAIDKVRKDVREGMAMWLSMEKTKQFPKMVVAMVKIGEETGRLDEMLDTIARFYEDEVDRTVEALISLIEPMLIVFLGVIIGGILVGLYMPIFKMGELLR